jgi:ornithine--oxo-acid transaminase
VWVWDIKGKKYLDMLSTYSALNFGHSHPALVQTLFKQAARLALTSRAFYNDQLGPLLQKLCRETGMDKGIMMNSGSEAVETAIKAVRRWGYRVKKIPENRAEIIVVKNNFHGRTTTIISFSSEDKYKKNFGPFTPGFKTVPFGDAGALQQAITPYTCAFLVEPMQGEAGIKIPPKGWLKEIAEICKKNHILLILDEIQTGLGRTGKFLACEHEKVHPDGLILGKALGGGLLPVSAFLGKEEIMSLFEPGSHGSTFGGNPLGAALAIKALDVLRKEKLIENSAKLGSYMLQQMEPLSQHPSIVDIRGKGLWIGLEFNPKKASA